jgi:predicted HTH domain antitoxin
METILNIPINNDVLLSMNKSGYEFGEELKCWAAISMYYFGKISISRAASLAGMHRYDFEKLLAEYSLPISLLNEKDAKDEINKIDLL